MRTCNNTNLHPPQHSQQTYTFQIMPIHNKHFHPSHPLNRNNHTHYASLNTNHNYTVETIKSL
eukprot:gene13205-9051_t